jgi:hypothetical protein
MNATKKQLEQSNAGRSDLRVQAHYQTESPFQRASDPALVVLRDARNVANVANVPQDTGSAQNQLYSPAMPTIQKNLALVACAVVASLSILMGAEPARIVPSGSRIYVDAADGFDTYLSAALQKKASPEKSVGH